MLIIVKSSFVKPDNISLNVSNIGFSIYNILNQFFGPLILQEFLPNKQWHIIFAKTFDYLFLKNLTNVIINKKISDLSLLKIFLKKKLKPNKCHKLL